MQKHKILLSADDCQAVDLVLDHANGHSGADSNAVKKHSATVSPKRVAAVTRLLHLLNEVPVADPPADLIARTMARIDRDLAERSTGDHTGLALHSVPPVS